MPQAEPAMRAFDEPRHVGDDKTAVFAQADDAEIRRQCGERVVGDLRPRRGDPRDQRRLAGVRIADKADVGEQLQLEAQILDLAFLARLHFPRRAIRRRREAGIAHAAASALRDQHALAFLRQIGDEPPRLVRVSGLLVHERAHRHREL